MKQTTWPSPDPFVHIELNSNQYKRGKGGREKRGYSWDNRSGWRERNDVFAQMSQQGNAPKRILVSRHVKSLYIKYFTEENDHFIYWGTRGKGRSGLHCFNCDHVGSNEHGRLRCLQHEAASQHICPTGANKQLWGACKVPKLWPSPVSRLPAGAIKLRQSPTLASLYLWRYTAPRWLECLHPPPTLPPPTLQGICHSPVISSIDARLPQTAASVKVGREHSKLKWWPLFPSSRFNCCEG